MRAFCSTTLHELKATTPRAARPAVRLREGRSRRKYSHQLALSSRRWNSSMCASANRACSSSDRSSGSMRAHSSKSLVAELLQLPVQLTHCRRSPCRPAACRTRKFLAARDHFRAKRFEPVPQLQRGLAIFPVVVLDDAAVPIDRSETAVGDRALYHSPALRCFTKILLALVTEERLEVLDGVPLDTGQQGPLDDLIQIHEGPPAQQLVELDLPSGVAAHEALQSRGLIRCKVIDMGVRVAPSSTR